MVAACVQWRTLGNIGVGRVLDAAPVLSQHLILHFMICHSKRCHRLQPMEDARAAAFESTMIASA